MENKMQLTVVEISDKELFNGAKVRHIKSGQIRTIRTYPDTMTISEAVKAGLFGDGDIDYDTVMLNKTRFELVVDEELLKFEHKQKVIDTIINMVDIRGIELIHYRKNFEESGLYEELVKLFKDEN